jgi:hypothetical protein
MLDQIGSFVLFIQIIKPNFTQLDEQFFLAIGIIQWVGESQRKRICLIGSTGSEFILYVEFELAILYKCKGASIQDSSCLFFFVVEETLSTGIDAVTI